VSILPLQVFLALSVAKWQAFAAVALGSMAGVSFPAISSIKSTHSRDDQQGLVQGALAGDDDDDDDNDDDDGYQP